MRERARTDSCALTVIQHFERLQILRNCNFKKIFHALNPKALVFQNNSLSTFNICLKNFVGKTNHYQNVS